MPAHTAKFRKTLTSLDILIVAFGAMIGWGWVVSSGEWIATAGVLGTALGFVLGGLLIYFVGLVYAELTTAMPKNGGCLNFCNRAFNPAVSFVCTWAMLLGYIGVVCFEACSLPTVLAYIFPQFLQGYLYTVGGFDVYASWLATSAVSAIVITAVNIRGIKQAARLQNALTFILALVGVLLIVSSALRGSPSNLEGQLFASGGAGTALKNLFAISAVAPFFLFGFDVIPQVAEEVNVSPRRIGKLLVLSILLAVGFYVLVVVAIGYALNAGALSASLSANGLAAADAMQRLFGNDVMAKVLILGGLAGIVTSWNSFLIGGSRALCALAEARMVPAVFAKIHRKHGTPVNALLLIGALSVLAPLLGRSMLGWISNSASFACCLAYGMVSVAFLVLRRRDPTLERPFKVKHWRCVGVLAVAMCAYMVAVYLLPGTGGSFNVAEWLIVAVWALLGLAFALFCRKKHPEVFRKRNKS